MPYNRIRKAYTRKPPSGAKPNFAHPQLIGCELWWPFTEGAGGVIRDAYGRFDGTIYGSSWEVSKIGTALKFGGIAADYVLSDAIPDGHILDVGGDTSLCMALWLRFDANVEGRAIAYATGKDSNTHDKEIISDTLGRVYSYVFSGGAKASYATTKPGDDGDWYHIVLRYDGPNNDLGIWVNGVLENSGTTANNTQDITNPLIVLSQHRGGDYYNGAIADVKIFPNVVLPDAQVHDLYSKPWAPYSRPLPIWIPSGAAPPAWNNTINEIAAPGAVNEITNANIQSVNEI